MRFVSFLRKGEGLGELQEEATPWIFRFVRASISLECRISTASPWCAGKSAPRIGFWTSVMMKVHGSERRRPRLRVSECCP